MLLAITTATFTAVLFVPPLRAQKFTVLHVFTDQPDGAVPLAGLLIDKKGNLYGTTAGGGTKGPWGTAFEVTTTGQETVLYSFAGSYGENPASGLIPDGKGNVYGTAQFPGSAGGIYQLSASGDRALYTFPENGTQGFDQVGNLVRDAAGNFYGAMAYGGTGSCSLQIGGCGTVYKISPDGQATVLHNFSSDTGGDGWYPQAGLTLAPNGDLYGTTSAGGDRCGTYGCGTVYKVSASGAVNVVFSFSSTGGTNPAAPLIFDSQGNGYGTTLYGGTHGLPGGDGTVFEITKSGQEKVLYNFAGGSDGQYPFAGVVRDAKGNLYGTTHLGGKYSAGTVFMVTPSGTEKVLHVFTGGEDGGIPVAGLTLDPEGNLYGTTSQGGDLQLCSNNVQFVGCGTVFKITP